MLGTINYRASCTRPVQDKASQNFSIYSEGTSELVKFQAELRSYKEQLASGGESHNFLKDRAPERLSRDGPTPKHSKEIISRLIGLQQKSI